MATAPPRPASFITTRGSGHSYRSITSSAARRSALHASHSCTASSAHPGPARPGGMLAPRSAGRAPPRSARGPICEGAAIVDVRVPDRRELGGASSISADAGPAGLPRPLVPAPRPPPHRLRPRTELHAAISSRGGAAPRTPPPPPRIHAPSPRPSGAAAAGADAPRGTGGCVALFAGPLELLKARSPAGSAPRAATPCPPSSLHAMRSRAVRCRRGCAHGGAEGTEWVRDEAFSARTWIPVTARPPDEMTSSAVPAGAPAVRLGGGPSQQPDRGGRPTVPAGKRAAPRARPPRRRATRASAGRSHTPRLRHSGAAALRGGPGRRWRRAAETLAARQVSRAFNLMSCGARAGARAGMAMADVPASRCPRCRRSGADADAGGAGATTRWRQPGGRSADPPRAPRRRPSPSRCRRRRPLRRCRRRRSGAAVRRGACRSRRGVTARRATVAAPPPPWLFAGDPDGVAVRVRSRSDDGAGARL